MSGYCTRCKAWVGAMSAQVSERISLCEKCGLEWEASPESKRLAAITQSIYSEWVERLRCEAIVHAAPNAGQGEGS